MQGVVTWETLIGMAVILGAVVGVWLRIEYRLGALIKAEIEPVNEAHISTRTELAAIHAELRLRGEQLAEHKLYAANHYAKLGDVREMRDDIMKQMEKMDARLDQAFAPIPRPTPAKTPAR